MKKFRQGICKGPKNNLNFRMSFKMKITWKLVLSGEDNLKERVKKVTIMKFSQIIICISR
jgi:hypothetical protein